MDSFMDTIRDAIYSLPPGIILPLVFAMLVCFCKPSQGKLIRSLALIGTLAPCFWFLFIAAAFNWSNGTGDHFVVKYNWFPAAGISLSFGADTITMLLVGLTVLLGPICVLASYSAITERLRTYYAWLLILQAAMTGVFLARDMILFYTFFEFTLVPLYILINLYGSTNRRAAATKFFLYTFTGSLITLAGLVYVAVKHHTFHNAWTFDFQSLATTARAMTAKEQCWVFWALLAGFAIKVPLFPVHTWLPLAHTEAPTAGSVILAGVLLKLGTYGIFRFALGFTPVACIEFAPTMAILSIIGIVYAGLICWVQTDVKKLVAYSSVSHLGYCVLGLFALNSVGLTGSVLYMINHGLSTGALFLLIGMVYERYHTRSLKEMGGLARVMPIWASFMVFFAMASVGLPGLNGFISELMCMLGAFQSDSVRWAAEQAGHKGLLSGATPGELGPWYALAAGTGVIVTAMYLLYMLGKIVWGPLHEPGGHGAHAHDNSHAHSGLSKDLNAREIGILLPLAALCLILGIFPKPILRALEPPTAAVARMIQNTRQPPPPTGRAPKDEMTKVSPTEHPKPETRNPKSNEGGSH